MIPVPSRAKRQRPSSRSPSKECIVNGWTHAVSRKIGAAERILLNKDLIMRSGKASFADFHGSRCKCNRKAQFRQAFADQEDFRRAQIVLVSKALNGLAEDRRRIYGTG
jgi:hypothetical protein